MRPASGVSKPASRRRSVVLPQPEPPNSANSSPRATSRSTPATASTSPKRLVSPSIWTIGPFVKVKSSPGLDRGPEPGAFSHLLRVGGRNGVELGAHSGRRIDRGIFRDRFGEQRRGGGVAVGVARDRTRGGRDLGIEHEIEEPVGLLWMWRVLGDRGDVDPEQGAFPGNGIGDFALVRRLRGSVTRLQDVAGIAEGEADIAAGQRVDVLRGMELADVRAYRLYGIRCFLKICRIAR